MIYPSYWVHTITVYHKSDADGVVSWKRQYADGCFWGNTSSASRSDGHVKRYGRTVCRLRCPVSVDIEIGDIIVKGKTKDTIDEYTSGSRSTDLVNKYGVQCFIVTGLHDNTDDVRGLPHLFVEGAAE